MSLITLFARLWGDSSWHNLVERIAITCAAQVQPNLGSSVHTMSAAERYGYLRARSTAVVQRESRLHGANFSRARYVRLVTDVHERVVTMLVDNLRKPQAVPVRRAA